VLGIVGRLQAAIPRFEQARLALDGERERIARRLHDAEAVLAALAATPRPLPGSEEDWAMATSARQAEGDAGSSSR